MQTCERCGRGSAGEYDLHDYCADCGKNLCGACMKDGCCGHVPALSGMEADDEPEAEPQPAGEHLQMSATDHEYERGAFGVCRQCGREAKDHR